MFSRKMSDPVGEERGFTGARFAENHQRHPAVAGGMLIEPVKILLTTNVNLAATLRVRVMIHRLAIQRIRLRTFWKQTIDDGSQVAEQELAQYLGIGIILANRKAAFAN